MASTTFPTLSPILRVPWKTSGKKVAWNPSRGIFRELGQSIQKAYPMLKVENFRIENIGQRKYSARGFEIYIGPVFRRRFSPKNRGGRDPLAKLRELPARTEAKHGQNFPLKIRYSPRYGKLVASIFFRSNFTTEDRR